MTCFKRLWLFLFIITPLLCLQCSGTNAIDTAGRNAPIKSKLPSKVAGTAVVLNSIGPDTLSLNSANNPLVQFALATNQPDIALKSVKFDQTGTLKRTDIIGMKLYLDNGDDIFDPGKDILLASSQLKGNVYEFSLEQPIISKAQSFFITVDLNAGTPGTISLLFNEESFGTTDVIGVTGPYPFSTAPVEVSALTAPGNDSPIPQPSSVRSDNEIASHSARNDKGKAADAEDNGDVLSELEKAKAIRMQENEFLAQKRYEAGLKLFKEFNYIQANDELVQALELNPRHIEARRLQLEIEMILGTRPEEIKVVKEFLQDQLSVKIQETEVEVRAHFLNGERLTAEKKYSEAESEFEAVITKLKWLPYDIGLKDYLTKSQERLNALQVLIAKQEQASDKQMRDAAAQMAQEEELKAQQAYNEKIKEFFKQALTAFGQKRFEEAERKAEAILEMSPHFKAAEELKKESIRARHYEVSEKYIKMREARFKGMYDDFKETVIPYAGDRAIRYDPEVWKTASRRNPPALIASKSEEDPDIAEIKRKLKTIRHDFKLEGNDTLYDVTDYIQQQYKIPIIYAADVRQEGLPNDKKTLSLTGLTLEVGLRNLLDQYGLAYGFDKEVKILKITKATAMEEELEWRVYNLDDLAKPIPEFPGPNIELPLTPGGQLGWVAPPMDTLTPVTIMTVDELMDLIKKNTGKDRKGASTWEGNMPGVNIRKIGESNKMLVVHAASVQNEITEFLRVLRSFRNAMISVEATFLNISDSTLENFGVELRNIPRVSIPNAPNIPGQSNPSAGLLLGGNRDARFRTAYTFRDQNNQVENVLPQSAVGGLGLQMAVLGQPRINMLMSALAKSGKGVIMDSPRITALNGQRVNVAFLKQRQYVQDGDIQAGAVAYEPVINTYSTGIVLEVKPIMSYDRKFINVQVFPTLMELADSRETRLEYQSTPPGVTVELRTEITIEKPWLRVQRCRTNAEIPDSGALVLGGLDTSSNQNLTASTPLMDKIPILAPFFRRKIKTEENIKQYIIVRAWIIELEELEQELR